MMLRVRQYCSDVFEGMEIGGFASIMAHVSLPYRGGLKRKFHLDLAAYIDDFYENHTILDLSSIDKLLLVALCALVMIHSMYCIYMKFQL